MTFKELKNFISQIPKSYDDYEMVNGEVGYLDPTDEDSIVYRVDKPIIMLYVDEATKELCFFHQTREEIGPMFNQSENNGDTETT